jgi:hypothetical protein
MTDEYMTLDADAEAEDDKPDWDVPVPAGVRRLTKDQIKAVDDRPLRELYIPEWNGTVLIQGVNRKQFFKSVKQAQGRGGRPGQQQLNLETMEAVYLADALVDPKFSPNEIADMLMDKNAGAIQRIRDCADSLSGMNKEERAAAANAFRNG